MSTTPTAITTEVAKFLPKLRGFIGAALFLALRRFPRLVQVYRNENSWAVFRFVLACFGASMVILPLGLWKGWMTAIFGLVLFVVSILLPPAELESATDRKARELGAQTVVSGGDYQSGNRTATAVELFISPSQTWAMDKRHEPQVVITTGDIATLDVLPNENHWLLIVRWGDHKAEFLYKGIFAERFARLAEESLRQASLAAQPPSVKQGAASV